MGRSKIVSERTISSDRLDRRTTSDLLIRSAHILQFNTHDRAGWKRDRLNGANVSRDRTSNRLIGVEHHVIQGSGPAIEHQEWHRSERVHPFLDFIRHIVKPIIDQSYLVASDGDE